MSDAQDSAVLEVLGNSMLNLVICFVVHGRCCLVQNEDLSLPDQSPCKRKKVLFSQREIGTVFFHFSVQVESDICGAVGHLYLTLLDEPSLK